LQRVKLKPNKRPLINKVGLELMNKRILL